MIPSPRQRDIFEAVATSTNNLVVRARAGSGKTTTAVMALNEAPTGGKLLVAFNKHIAEELRARTSDDVDVKTLHALGLATLRRQFGRMEVEPDKGLMIARRIAAGVPTPLPHDRYDVERLYRDLPWSLKQLSSLYKQVQPASMEEAVRMVYDFDMDNPVYPPAQMAELAVACLKEAVRDPRRVDFDDMIYLPHKLELYPTAHSLVVIDETQDLNRGQLWLVLMGAHRVLAIGDERQAIYRWRGADSEAMNRIIEGLDADVLPLSVTYRCAQSVVDYVKSTLYGLDDFTARPDAPEGLVEGRSCAIPEPGDFVLSRWNALLIPAALEAARDGVPVHVLGRDLTKQLNGMIRQSEARTCTELVRWSIDTQTDEIERLLYEERPDKIPSVKDRYLVMRNLARGCDSITGVRNAIRRLFTSKPVPNAVTFSSVHKAKGHERDRVWLLMDSIRQPGQDIEEDNIHYVAATRAREELYLVREEKDPPHEVAYDHYNWYERDPL